MKLTGAEIIMECLLEQGVDTVFGYPGGAVLNIYDALYQYHGKIRHITTAHEQAAAHAADGYARSSGKTGVCVATSGPGATNLVTGIATAYMDSIPMVAITGNVGRSLLGKSSFQEVDIAAITAPVTKKSSIVMDIADLADTIRDAFYIANKGRKGPVLIDIPKDITALTYEYEPKTPVRRAPHFDLNETQFARALKLLSESKRPLLYAGGGVVAAEAEKEFESFVERLDAPVSASLMCQGAYDQKKPRYLGMLGMHGTKVSSLAMKECDLFIAVGSRFSDRVTCNTDLFARHCPVIHIDIDAKEFNKNVKADAALRGSASAVLAELLKRMPQQDHTEWMRRIMQWKEENPFLQKDGGCGVTPQLVMETLGELTDSQAMITTEVGQHQMWAVQYYYYRYPRQLCTSGGLGTMGYGLGAAIGAKLANPDKTVVNIAGDGSFHMNASELSTLSKYNIPVIELLFNNEVLGMVRQWQKLFYGSRFSETNLDKPTNYEALAEAFGVKAYTITRRDEVAPVLKKAIASGKPAFINCLIDRDMNVLPMVPANGSVTDPIFEME